MEKEKKPQPQCACFGPIEGCTHRKRVSSVIRPKSDSTEEKPLTVEELIDKIRWHRKELRKLLSQKKGSSPKSVSA